MMIPELMFHGTFKKFDKFDLSLCSPTAYCGPGVYLTNEFCDAHDFYADTNSGDTQAKIGNRADELLNEDEGVDYDDAVKIAESEICGHGSYVMECKPKVSNPLKLAKYRPKGTYIELWKYNGDDEEPELTEAYNTISDILESQKIEFCPDDSEISAFDLLKICQECSWDELSPGKIFQDIAKELGYDSILMIDVETFFPMYRGYSELNHLIIFSPDNVEILQVNEV